MSLTTKRELDNISKKIMLFLMRNVHVFLMTNSKRDTNRISTSVVIWLHLFQKKNFDLSPWLSKTHLNWMSAILTQQSLFPMLFFITTTITLTNQTLRPLSNNFHDLLLQCDHVKISNMSQFPNSSLVIGLVPAKKNLLKREGNPLSK